MFNGNFFPSGKPFEVLMPLLFGKISIPIDILQIYSIFRLRNFYAFIFINPMN